MGGIIAYCGLVCDECPAYIATRSGDSEKLEELAGAWSSDQDEFGPADIQCDGCRAGGARLFAWCNDCGIRTCCLNRGLENCAHCTDFPCQEIDKAPPQTKETLTEMRAAIHSA
jgi:hypothetical protein